MLGCAGHEKRTMIRFLLPVKLAADLHRLVDLQTDTKDHLQLLLMLLQHRSLLLTNTHCAVSRR